jgi:thiol-disulfide isomerase/thioredoxin
MNHANVLCRLGFVGVMLAALWMCPLRPGGLSGVPAAWAAVNDDVPLLTAQTFADMLHQAKGKVVVINFFASWCPPCREEIPGLMRLRKRYSQDQVVFLGLSVDQDMRDIKDFLAKTPLNYPVYLADPVLAHMYSVSAIPHNTVYDKAGRIVGNQPGMIEERDMRHALDELVRQP